MSEQEKHEHEGHCCHHEHEHEHDEHCCHHEHEHDEHCCHHEHEHEHDEHCCCHDHDHEHEHEHTVTVVGYRVFETHTHEGATVCSFEKDIEKEGAFAAAEVNECFEIIRSWLQEKGAIIGHIKGYIQDNGAAITFSTVGGEVNRGYSKANGAVLGFASIVFGVSPDEMKEKVIEVFAGI